MLITSITTTSSAALDAFLAMWEASTTRTCGAGATGATGHDAHETSLRRTSQSRWPRMRQHTHHNWCHQKSGATRNAKIAWQRSWQRRCHIGTLFWSTCQLTYWSSLRSSAFIQAWTTMHISKSYQIGDGAARSGWWPSRTELGRPDRGRAARSWQTRTG
jgi:hypothetical protein